MKSLLLALLLTALPYSPVDQLIPQPVSVTAGKAPSFRKMTKDLPEYAKIESYRIICKGGKFRIKAHTPAGRFRAKQTLRKLQLAGSTVPDCIITDYPRFEHRGLMIDESRSFKGKEFIKKQLDAMALLGLNTLHLHLTDAAGWRIEIKSHPELCQRAAWRIGRTYAEWEKNGYPFSTQDDPAAYGGYYTHDDLREIVAYAGERFINVIPEIEMPGHSMEVNRTYPELACLDSTGRRRNWAWDLCPGNEGTFTLLEDVLREVISIFPYKYVHIGGDEAVMKDWPVCVNCKHRMQEEGYKDVHQLQGYLVRRMVSWLQEHGRIAIGWDEILETGVPQDAVIQSWRGSSGGKRASEAGHKVIMSPNTHCYFDYYQDLIKKEPLAVGELTSLHWVYTYDPGDDPNILGLQANLWCEKVPTQEHAEYMLYPRLFAIAEIGWTPGSRHKDADEFRTRARALLDIFRELGYNTFDMDNESDFAKAGLRRTNKGEIIFPLF